MAQLIVALDFSDRISALKMVDRLEGVTRWFKVGLELYTACGPDIVRTLKHRGFKVFLDLKFMDIPNTVHGAVRAARALDVDMLTLHLLGGREMIAAALQARDENISSEESGPLLFGVTLLTSLTAAHLPWPSELATGELILHLAHQGADWGLDGVVCSGQEVRSIKRSTTRPLLCLTPGIRHAGPSDDQKRSVTPEAALAAGSDFLVVGRPIIAAQDPREQAMTFLKAVDGFSSP
jgi:orotidine-5'-phosphate decarboxylase